MWVALHVLLHMSEVEGAITSEALGPLMKANPVVLRRTLAGLRDAGIVRSDKGHGGGWSLARRLDAVTLADVHAALDVTALFTIGQRDARTRCPLEQAVNRAMDESMTRAEALLLERMRAVTVADLLADARRRMARRHRKESRAHA
jgi:DNA-binding IscR family transcriptional regulator